MGESHSAAEPEEGDTAPARAALANRPPKKPAKAKTRACPPLMESYYGFPVT